MIKASRKTAGVIPVYSNADYCDHLKSHSKYLLFIEYIIMAAKKKGGVVTVAMVCSECKATNYFTSINKATTPKLAQTKYCKHCRKHTEHTSKEKLK